MHRHGTRTSWYGDSVYQAHIMKTPALSPHAIKKPYLVIPSRPKKFLSLAFTSNNLVNATNFFHIQMQNVMLKSDGMVEALGSLADS